MKKFITTIVAGITLTVLQPEVNRMPAPAQLLLKDDIRVIELKPGKTEYKPDDNYTLEIKTLFDIDGNGKTDLAEAIYILQILSGVEKEKEN